MTETHMKPLDKRSRLQELARLLGAAKSPAIRSRMRKNCWRINFFGSQGHTEQQKRRQTVSKWARSIIIGILHMSRVLLGRKGIKSLCAVKR
ncbi:recombination and repair protein [Enterobacter cloacae]|uniref:Recombination and repair protein n=1 Tax=Enterobacter cloacae TaxID=550 RepID=A0A377LWI5_ENTCL|nr:recombination and repair protein [Enterobacter cloacae]